MAYKALYRKYRPETFENVVGQKHIIKTLLNAIENNKVAHAYIFSGPRGTGKTTTAKLLAKALNCDCENKPCNECANCKAILDGSHPDIIEIDAASNNGVDEVRELIEKVKYAPIQGKFKVYIIDEVHMMTAGAFNALLKTLEEPPEHVVFILATTDVHKVIPTVLSRCQRFDFSKINFEDIKQRVTDILKLEDITFEEGVPSLVAELADGGMRDALSILDQVVSYAGDNVTLQHIYDIYGMMSNSDMVEYLTLLAENKTKEVLEMIENYIGKGIDVSEILNEARNNYRLSTNYRLFFELASLKIIESLTTNPNLFKEEVKPVVKEVIVEKIVEKVVEVKPTIEEKPIQKVEEKENKKEEVKQETTSNKYETPSESETITYSLEEYVNILCQGDKKFKENLISRWGEIRKHIDNLDTRYVAQLLSDSNVGVASKDFVLLVYDFKLLASRAKQKNNLILIRKFIKEIFDYDLEVYAVERSTFIDMTNKFFELKQAGKLPNRRPIPHLSEDNVSLLSSIVSNESEELKDATIELGLDLFGDALKIE